MIEINNGKSYFLEVENSDINFAIAILSYFLDKSLNQLISFIEGKEKEKNKLGIKDIKYIKKDNEFQLENSFEKINYEPIRFLFFLVILSKISLKEGNTYISINDIEQKEFEFSIEDSEKQKSVFAKNILNALASKNENNSYYYLFESKEKILSFIDLINKKRLVFENISNLANLKNIYCEKEFLQPPIFIFEQREKFYFRRFYLYEILIAKNISERLEISKLEEITGNAKVEKQKNNIDNNINKIDYINAFLEIFSGQFDKLQIDAVKNALLNNFVLISGGPGTGKTFVLSLIVLAHLYIYKMDPSQIIAVAPTGKAAKRVKEILKDKIVYFNNIIKSKGEKFLGDKKFFGNKINENSFDIDAITIHRFLKSSEYSLSFIHNKKNPIQHKLIIVDEASMIDIPLMAKMLDAIPAESKIILSGDANQLSSVEAGRVFADLKEYLAYNRYLQNFIEFKKSYRYEKDSFVENARDLLNDILNEKDSEKIDSKISNFIEFLDKNNRLIETKKFEFKIINDFFKLDEINFNCENIYNLLDQLHEINKSFKLLSPLRMTSSGTYSINKLFAKLLKEKGNLQRGDTQGFVPIIITRNNYQLNLFNGDIGFLIDEDDQTFAYFVDKFDEGDLKKDQKYPKYPISALSDWEPAYCLTVHKSQGSEFDVVALIIPAEVEKYSFITLELIYTAITRARKDFLIFGSKESLSCVLKNRTKRATGLFEKLVNFSNNS